MHFNLFCCALKAVVVVLSFLSLFRKPSKDTAEPSVSPLWEPSGLIIAFKHCFLSVSNTADMNDSHDIIAC